MKDRILYAVADWGMGHATRSAVLIDYLLEQNIRPTLAASGSSLKWLQGRYPGLDFLKLPPYRVRYPYRNMAANLFRFGPALWSAVRQEQRICKDWVSTRRPDVLISDNRFGVWARGPRSVYITHQICIPDSKIPGSGRLANFWHHPFIRRHEACWVPDFPGAGGLSGALSHPVPAGLPPVRYIGPLSGMQRQGGRQVERIVAVLSGPEPQRSFLEQELRRALTALGKPALLVGGRVNDIQGRELKDDLEIVPWLEPEALSKALSAAPWVIARSGYSTLMDLWCLEKPCLLIPTPGQPEQVYLGHYWSKQPGVLVQRQGAIDLKAAAAAFTGRSRPFSRQFFGEPDNWRELLAALLSH